MILLFISLHAVLRQAQLRNILALGAEKNRKLRLEREAKKAAEDLKEAASVCGLVVLTHFSHEYI